jgi:NADH:ubiquinone oxidoreductase subunit 3 (subunit A)
VNRPTGTPSQALIIALELFILMLVVNWSALVGAIGTKAFIAAIIFIAIAGATFVISSKEHWATKSVA